jgi:hypothetical protein
MRASPRKLVALAALLPLLPACGASPKPASPAPRPSPTAAVATTASAASPPPDEAPAGPPVLVPQLLPALLDTAIVSPDGRLVLVDTQIAELFLLDAATGRVRGFRRACFQSYAFTPDSQRLVLGDCDDVHGHAWDLTTDTLTSFTVARKGNSALQLAVSPKGDAAAFYGGDRVAFVHLPDGASLGMYPHAPAEISNAAFSPAGDRLALGLSGGRLIVLGTDGHVVWEQKKHEGSVRVAWSPEGDRLVSGGDDAVGIWDADDGKSLARVTPCGKGWPVGLAWGQDGHRIAVGCYAPKAHREEARTRVALLRDDGSEERELVAGGQERPFRVYFDPSGKRLGATNAIAGHFVFDAAAGKTGFHAQVACASPEKYPLCWGGTFSSDLSRVAVGALGEAAGALRAVVAMDTATGREIARREGTEPRLVLTMGPSRKPLVSAGDHRWVWDPAGDDLTPLDDGEMSPDGKWVLRQDRESGNLALVDRAGGPARMLDRGSNDMLMASGFSPRSTRVVAVTLRPEQGDLEPEWKVLVWDAGTGKRQIASTGGPASISYEVSGDDKLLAHWVKGGGSCATQDPACFRVKVLDLEKGKALATIHPAEQDLEDESLAFGAGGKVLAISKAVYDARTGRKLWTTPAGTSFQGFLPGTDSALLLGGSLLYVVDARTGAQQRSVGNVDGIVDMAPDGASLLVVREGKPALLDMKTLERKALPFSLPEENSKDEVFLSGDGRLIHFPARDAVGIFRVSDGRVLYRHGVSDPLYATDEGVFDGTAKGLAKGGLRLGPDVRRSRVIGLEGETSGLRHPGLLADFVNDKPVGKGR